MACTHVTPGLEIVRLLGESQIPMYMSSIQHIYYCREVQGSAYLTRSSCPLSAISLAILHMARESLTMTSADPYPGQPVARKPSIAACKL